MKRIIVVAALVVACIFSDSFTAFSQNKSGVVTASSMIVTRTKIKKEKDPIKISWQNNIEANVTEYYELTYTGGWRFGNFLFLGFGTGLQVYPNVVYLDEPILDFGYGADVPDKVGDRFTKDYFKGNPSPSRIAVPLYANMKFRFTKGRVAPYLSVSGGLLFKGASYTEKRHDYDYEFGYGDYDEYRIYSDGVTGEYYCKAFVGVDVRLKNETSISLGLGPIWNGHDSDVFDTYLTSTAIGGFTLSVSF